VSTEQMREADRLAIAAGKTGLGLMERAGSAVADAANLNFGAAQDILVLCGPGNNGGDGFVAARLLAGIGRRVGVALLGPRERLTGDAAAAAAQWAGETIPLHAARPEAADLVIDAIFGAGLVRDLDGEARLAVERASASGRPILSVDVPSGVDGDSGQVRGTAVAAARTVTFAARKPGHVLLPGRALCGILEVADIGIGPDIIRAVSDRLYANAPDLWQEHLPRPQLSAHKYERGHTLVVSGGAARTGAARLAARGALRSGSGLVTVASPPEAIGVNAAQLTAIMIRGCDGPEGLQSILADRRFNALVLGPALGVHAVTRSMVAVALQARRNLVLDADALTSFQGMAAQLHQAFRTAPAVLTPHEGEFARLFEGEDDILRQPSKLGRAGLAASWLGATIVLKGPDTVIAAPDGRLAVNENGTPYLATAGSGDVLSGIIGGLMAQGMAAFEAACAGVFMHAQAGASFGPGLIAELLPQVLRRLLT
jgi:hydroxyethylthiazole kinase-like uncharacterized protein yjeF